MLSCIQLLIGVVGLTVRHKDNRFKDLMVRLFYLANALIILLWVYVFTVRYLHSGAECSGDYIVEKKEAKYLLYVEGMFIKFSSLLVFFVLLLILVGHCLNAMQRATGGIQQAISLDL